MDFGTFSRVWPFLFFFIFSHKLKHSNLSILSVPDEGYSRKASRALNLISTFLFRRVVFFVFPFFHINWYKQYKKT
jgi:hypothetical protein